MHVSHTIAGATGTNRMCEQHYPIAGPNEGGKGEAVCTNVRVFHTIYAATIFGIVYGIFCFLKCASFQLVFRSAYSNLWDLHICRPRVL